MDKEVCRQVVRVFGQLRRSQPRDGARDGRVADREKENAARYL